MNKFHSLGIALVALTVLAGGCANRRERHLVVTDVTHFAIQGGTAALNLPVLAGTLDVEKIVRDVTLAEYYYDKLSSVYDFKSFTFLGSASAETLLTRSGELKPPENVYVFDDSTTQTELALVSFENGTATYRFRLRDVQTGEVRDHPFDVPAGQSASIGTMFDAERNRGHLVSVSMQYLKIDKSTTPEQLAEFLRAKNTPRGGAPSERFEAEDQRWMNELYGTRAIALLVKTPTPSGDSTAAVRMPFDSPPEPLGGIAAIGAAVVYPGSAKAEGAEGRVMVMFLVDEGGQVKDCRVIKSVRPDLDSAAVRALMSIPFKPARYQGKPIAVEMTAPIVFRLDCAPK